MKNNNIPEYWKKNLLYTIYKNKNPFESKNYRPITLMNIIYKIFISIINFISSLSIYKTKNEKFIRY